jgi:16S rRNA (cytosine1402-N4)-methyltransferase
MMDAAVHDPVLVEEVVDCLDCRPGKRIVDATLGGGGHAVAILDKVGGEGVLVGIDKDDRAIHLARKRLAGSTNAIIYRMDWLELDALLNLKVDGFLMDLGLASFQVDDPSRGFSFSSNGPLDMRFDRRSELTASILANSLSEQELTELMKGYGEERYSARIARAIVSERAKEEITTTLRLSEIIRTVVRGNPRKALARCFQAFRIAVNDEIRRLREALTYAAEVLWPGGRICVVTYHSLEDRIVKLAFRNSASGLRALTRRPIVPSAEEISSNPRARSAKLRVAERKDG